MTAAVMTYDSLVADIGSYLERTDADTVNQIPRFIALAEHTIATAIKFLGNLSVVTGNFITGEPVLEKPAGWRKTVSMMITVEGRKTPVFLRKYEVLRVYSPDDTVTGTPKYYADYDYSHWLIAPTPDEAYSFEVMYYEEVQPLDATNQVNWFTQYAPQAMLYGSLLQAMPFLKNDERMPLWRAEYDKIVAQLKTENIQRLGDRQAIAQDS